MRRILALPIALAGVYVLIVRGALTLDLGVGRRTRPLGPLARTIVAPPETIFDVIAAPYLGRTPRAMQDKLQVWERGSDMALAAHFTPAGRLTTTTVETVRFERPHRISFRLLRGPVPHVVESYELRPVPAGTEFVYSGELGTDFWALGAWWGDRVAAPWERAVAKAIDSIQAESERRAGPRRGTTGGVSASPPLCPTCGQPASQALGGPEHDWECRNESCSEFGQPVRADEPPPREQPDPTGP